MTALLSRVDIAILSLKTTITCFSRSTVAFTGKTAAVANAAAHAAAAIAETMAAIRGSRSSKNGGKNTSTHLNLNGKTLFETHHGLAVLL